MALPKIELPTYEVNVPSTGETIKVRPFTVKEEKLIMIALETKDPDEIIKTVKQVINNCLISGKLNVDKAPFFDIDFLFIFLRAKSVGESVEVTITCNNVIDEKLCGNKFPTRMNISNCEIIKDETLKDEIDLDGNRGIKMKYPNYAIMKRIEFGSEVDKKTNILINCIEHIYDDKGIYPARDHSKDELKEFVEGLTEENYKKLERFVDNAPTFAVRLNAKCTKCGFEHDVRYTDFYDFFF